jgi:beta-lactamase regulating signal transducer with metallopeptidase domain
MTAYILKSSLSLLLLFGLYWLLLRNEKFFVFNRIFLVASVVFSMVVPFIYFPVNIQTIPKLEYFIPAYNHTTLGNIFVGDVVPNAVNNTQSFVQNNTTIISISVVLFILYFSGVLLFLIRFLRNLYLIIQRSRLSEKISFNNFKIVLTNDTTGPCCFFNNIFLNREDYLNGRIDKELLDHEMEHAKQSHTVDIILIELVKIFYWFNPIHLLYERAIRINHEYLADNGVIKVNSDIESYTDKLLSFITCRSNMSLTSGSNNSFTKMRLIMIMKSRSGRFITGARISTTLVMLIFFTLILSFKRSNTLPITSMTNHKDARNTLLIYEDSLKTNMTILKLKPQPSNVIDKKVTYTASGYIKRDTINKIIILVDNAIVSFGEISIKADSIVLNIITNQLFATGRLNKSGEIIGKPNFKEGSQEIEADELTYNLDTRKGILKNVNGRVNFVPKDSGSLVNPSTHNQIYKINK